MEYITYMYELISAVLGYHWLIPNFLMLGSMLFLGFWSFQRNPIPTIRGFESLEKGKEIAPEIFGEPEKDDDEHTS